MKNETKDKIKKVVDSKVFKGIIYSFGILIIVFFIFEAGIVVGFRRVSFDRDWSNNYAMNFGSPRGGGPQMMGGQFNLLDNLPNAHGAIGKIIKTELPTIIVLDEKDNTEKVVLIDNKTQIRQGRVDITPDQLKVDDSVVIIGEPNSSGQIEARLIRFLPAPLEQAPIIKTN